MDNSTLVLLPLISERARREPKLQFTSLVHLLDKPFLRECYLELGRDRASGIDGVSWQAYGENLSENLANLVERMKVKKYRPQPAKRVYIPKNENEERPLSIPPHNQHGNKSVVTGKPVAYIHFVRLFDHLLCYRTTKKARNKKWYARRNRCSDDGIKRTEKRASYHPACSRKQRSGKHDYGSETIGEHI